MDWLRSDDAVWEQNMDILTFEPIQCQVLTIARDKTGIHTRRASLTSDQDWESWLATDPLNPAPESSSQINLVVGARAPVEPLEPAAVSYLPFSESTFRKLIDVFRIHGTIARTINRNTDLYNCRSSASWAGDLAMSVTFCPSSLISHVVMYGCDEDVTNQIVRRLSNSDLLEFHPMVPVALFAELEWNRLDKLVHEKTTALLQRIVNMMNCLDPTMERNSGEAPSLASSIRDCLEMGNLKNVLQAFKRKVVDMIQHADELEADVFNPSEGPGGETVLSETQLHGLKDSGFKIKDRLKHLVDEFEGRIQTYSLLYDALSMKQRARENHHAPALLPLRNPGFFSKRAIPSQKQHSDFPRATIRRSFHGTAVCRDDAIDNARNHYETLKVAPNASASDIKKSFYNLSKSHHPDLHEATARRAAARRFMRISEAYSILSSPTKREKYDREHMNIAHSTTHAHVQRKGSYAARHRASSARGGWGAHGEKRKSAHDDSTGGAGSPDGTSPGTGTAGRGTMGGMGPGQDPFGHRDDVPHFDKEGHQRTGRNIDRLREARWESANQSRHRVTTEPERSVTTMFFVIGSALLLSFLGPFFVSQLWHGNTLKPKEKRPGRA
ncbi:hypothetical protein EKO27_g3507 [Xylaria grammica]|uniref:J domain-containing protein n=1 Tax=Xylaria grammica TaxID=363999 RepID=A0A439DB05_9PEZI|nr:hypothetical protein EKO27_g3507 [Xylaria grammica]